MPCLRSLTLALLTAGAAWPAALPLTVVNPGEDEFVGRDQLVVVVSFPATDSGDTAGPSSAEVTLDSTRAEGPVILGRSSVTWIPPSNTPAGPHAVLVRLKSAGGVDLGSVTWRFTLLAPSAERTDTTVTGRRLQQNGLVFAEASQYDFDKDNSWELRTGGAYRASCGKLRFGAEISLCNQNDPRSQDRNVYRADIEYGRWLSLQGGDVRVSYAPEILANMQVRGFAASAQAWLPSGVDLANLDITYGQASRAAEPETYERNIFAGRLSFGSGSVFQLGLTFLKGRDDPNSIGPVADTLVRIDSVSSVGDTARDTSVVAGATPAENAVAGADVTLRLFRRRLEIYGNFAFSVYTRDIRDSTLTRDELDSAFGVSTVDPKSVRWLITLNQSSLPLYSGRGILNSSYIDGGLRLHLPFPALTESFEAAYKLQGANYQSMGATLLGTGEQGFTVSDRVLALANRLMVEATYGRYWNNLDELQSKPTVTDRVTVALSFFYSPKAPSVTLTYAYNGASNLDTTYGFTNAANLLNAIGAYNYRLGRLAGTLQIFGGWSALDNRWRNAVFGDSSGVTGHDTSSTFGTGVYGVNILGRLDGVPATFSAGLRSNEGGDQFLQLVTGDVAARVSVVPSMLDLSVGVTLGAERSPDQPRYAFQIRVPYGAELRYHEHHTLRFDGYVASDGGKFDIVNTIRYEWRF